jgi:mercuric ion binding protein
MKKQFFLLLLTLFLVPEAFAEEARVTVKGMVCSFCAQGIEKVFEKRNQIQAVTVNLDQTLVVIIVKKGTTLTDAEIRSDIEDAGYEVEKIERVPDN